MLLLLIFPLLKCSSSAPLFFLFLFATFYFLSLFLFFHFVFVHTILIFHSCLPLLHSLLSRTFLFIAIFSLLPLFPFSNRLQFLPPIFLSYLFPYLSIYSSTLSFHFPKYYEFKSFNIRDFLPRACPFLEARRWSFFLSRFSFFLWLFSFFSISTSIYINFYLYLPLYIFLYLYLPLSLLSL